MAAHLAEPAKTAGQLAALRARADQVFRRSAGAPLVGGNQVRVLRDARENYPAWEQAIEQAKRSIHIDMYIIHNDPVGRRFVDLLAARARAGVRVRLLYDWFGCGFGPLLGLFRPLIKAGGEAIPNNPPRITAALGWMWRDHRKYICIDGTTTYVAGLCVGRMWVGRPEKKQDPWRDTGIEIIGPSTAHGERLFADSWASSGGQIDLSSLPVESAIPAAGTVNLRFIDTEPFAATLLRVDLLVAAMARKRLWIADAYFIGHGPYVRALQQAAADGVDVRLLLPQGSDVGWTVPVSRTLYRTLLESGVRLFEWNGSMMHAKTAVADSQWARVGSTNLNLNSWVGNWELDVAIEDQAVAQTMEAYYEEDLDNSTEILSTSSRRARGRREHSPSGTTRAARRAIRTATGVSHSIGAAVLGTRQLEAWESAPLLTIGLLLLVLGALALRWPRVMALPFAIFAIWIGLTFVGHAAGLLGKRKTP